ncbi:hypothetical protein LIN78_08300 [Leeia sp. TBRC 13508]|uniref:Methyl-accepting transducer domain-containing protein n=1 Tax=Leeia speluncae TaxID=2884804 RepID=A0ABS8D5U2_9NEIS|nr:hypothetical protein [Leeia speluncae]MCB6183546.1 hypothetical protein [Leeia speluncae]
MKKHQKNAAEDLLDIVHLNEGIKQVVVIAFHINLMALNAILLANRAGKIALGFGVISKELRVLAVELTQLMHALKAEAHDSVNCITVLLRQERRRLLLTAAQSQVTNHTSALAGVIESHAAYRDEQVVRIKHLRNELLGKLMDARRICQFGIAISRSAKIEAAYGGSFSQQLKEVSTDFDQNIHAILPALDVLCNTLEDNQ